MIAAKTLLAFLSSKFVIRTGIVLVISLVLSGTGYFAYKEWKDLTAQNALLSKEIVQIKEEQEELKEQIEAEQIARTSLNEEIKESRRRQRELEAKFDNRDIDRLIQGKPTLTISVFQKGTDEFYKRVEEVTRND